MTKTKTTYISQKDFEIQIRGLLQDRYKSICKELDRDNSLTKEDRETVTSETCEVFNTVEECLVETKVNSFLHEDHKILMRNHILIKKYKVGRLSNEL